MCNKGIAVLSQADNPIDPHHNHLAVNMMDSPLSTTLAPGPGSGASSTPGSNDECPRVKFLCSFLGSIMPRPQDGKLRYVGGETRIVSLPRDISYTELMQRMRELYDGAVVLKYQQPDEDLDALVSVVNDDDVTNMMEEYEKLGSCDGFTRLRIFLFSHPDFDGSSHYVDGDDRDTERRYVDALNNMNDADFRKLPLSESPGMSPIDDLHATEQFVNLHNLNIPPHMGSGQLQQLVSQRYSEMEAPWSPAYYSPRHHGHLDTRPLADFPTSPSSARFHMPFGDFPDKLPEEYARQQVNHQPAPTYEHQPQFSDNVVWLPPGAIPGDTSGFPGNLLHSSNALEGNNICEHFRINLRNQSHLEQPNIANSLPPCNECRPHREGFMLNTDPKMHQGIYPKEQNDPRAVFNEAPINERGWVLQHQLNPRVEEARPHVTGAGRLNDHYTVDGPGMNFPPGHGNIAEAHHMSSNYVHHRVGPELGGEVFHDQVMAAAPHMHIPIPEERGVRYGNVPYAYGAENIYTASHRHVPAHVLWRNAQSPVHGSPSYEPSTAAQQPNDAGSPRFFIGGDSQNPWIESPQKMMGFDGASTPEYSYGLKLNPNTHTQDFKPSYSPDPVRSVSDRINTVTTIAPIQVLDSSPTLTHDKLVPATIPVYNPESINDSNVTEAAMTVAKSYIGEGIERNPVEKVEIYGLQSIPCPINKAITDNTSLGSVNSNCSIPAEAKGDMVKPGEKDLHVALDAAKQMVNDLTPELSDLSDSLKKVALEGSGDVKAKVERTSNSMAKDSTANEQESVNANGDCKMGSENDTVNTSKIEPTKAEAEAIARGLQTIRNDDLEEIRELGSGTYGAVYHGKWRGSDVAIKRIKASCFAGRPSDRERLIADFWKEALILSSLHHPNVVSFYGIVRDGPDGSLATVTEFMINGSLKQFLQKKDRTIDRRKRLIIAMDAAFGMEYLHGKNIVHFDLKCENLLVNMRDPQRPVCKIGDLGLSKVKQKTLVSGGVRGTLPWMAPELLSGKSSMVTEKIDVYSFAIVMWELLTGDEPYADMHCASIIGGIVNNTLRPQIPTWCDPEWKTLMQRCWASDPAERPSFSEISQKLRTMAAAINVK